MNYKLLINNVDYTQHLTLPTSIQQTLDESLNVGYIRAVGLSEAKAFQPFTPVRIEIGTQIYSLFVSSDEVTEIIARKEYTHSITLIEQSKWLERFTGITKTNTRPLIKDYRATQKGAEIYYKKGQLPKEILSLTTADILGETTGAKQILNPFLDSEFVIPSMNEFAKYITGPLGLLGPTNAVFKYNGNNYASLGPSEKDVVTKINTKDYEGLWEIELLHIGTIGGDPRPRILARYNYYITTYLLDETKLVNDYTIKDVIDNLLATAECKRASDTPRFTLNAEQATEFEQLQAPDFNLIGTLWECLSEIGGYLHAIPRLEDNVIYFDKLGGTSRSDISLQNFCSHTKKFDIEQYATSIDSQIDNIVNTDNKQQGTIVAPYELGYKTTRTDTGVVVITTDNCLIETREPIEEIVSLECGYLSDGRLVGDITPYVFESAEYNALSEFNVGYPMSRDFALVYTQGQNNIKGLSYKSPNAINPIFSEMSIINIIARKLGINASSIKGENIMNLQFRVKYIPIVSARLKQYKTNLLEFDTPSTLDYNQSANKINSVAFGENMKGVIARLGNPEISKMFILKDLAYIPKVGDLYDDDYYISVVKLEFYKTFYKCEVVLSKDFNKLNEYVGISSEKRFYEISEKQAVDRLVNYSDFCIISKTPQDTTSSVMRSALDLFVRAFNNEDYASDKRGDIDLVEVKGISKTQGELETVILPVNSISAGNSIALTFHYDDNFSAGNTRKVINNAQLQYQTKYTDIYGRVDYLEMYFGISKSMGSSYQTIVDSGNLLPRKEGIVLNGIPYIINAGDSKIDLRKDNRENINFTYQLNFIAENNKIVLGTAISRECPLITKVTKGYRAVLLNRKLGKFESEIAEGDILQEIGYLILSDNIKFQFIFGNAPQNALSMAFLKGNELVYGLNEEIVKDVKIDDIYFNFTHEIKQGE